MKLVTDSLYTTMAFFIQKGLGFVRELVLAMILGPVGMGLRNVIIMLNNYSVYSYLGIDSQVYREIAKHYDKSPDMAKHHQKVLQSWGFIVSMIIFIGLIIFSLVSHYSLEFKLALVFLAFITPVMINGINMANYMIAIGRFKVSSLIETIKTIFDFVITIFLAYFFGFFGAVLGFFIILVIRYFLYNHIYRRYGILFEWDYIFKRWGSFIETLKGGISLFITSIASTLYAQIDSLVTVLMLGPAALGIYGLATTLNQLVYSTYGSTVLPVGQRMYKSADEKTKLEKYVEMLSGISSYFMVFPIIGIVIISPYIINYFIPKFSDAIPVIGILAVASFFNVSLNPVTNYVVAKKREVLITVSTLIAAGINLILDIYLIQQGYGLIGVAYATSFSYFINYVLMIYLSRVLELKEILEDIIPFVYLLFMLWAWTTDWTFVLMVILTLVYIPIGYYVLRSRGVYDYLVHVLVEGFDRLMHIIRGRRL